MSNLFSRTEEEFLADFPIDFGSGHRGSLIRRGNTVVGIIEAHQKPENVLCATTIYWIPVEDRKSWKLKWLEPITLEPDIQCDCGVHGFIKEGQWHDA